ncbi:MAG: ATP-binding protein [Patescibacteria group bacterium]
MDQKIKNGTGLGLHIAKLLTGSIGGKIWFESEETSSVKILLEIYFITLLYDHILV